VPVRDPTSRVARDVGRAPVRGMRDADGVMNERSGNMLATALFVIAVAWAIVLILLYV
jgi:hypothetical protein